MFRAAFRSALAEYPQDRHRKTAWLSRAFLSTVSHSEQRQLVNAGSSFSNRPAALCSSRAANMPHPEARIARFSPAFCRTLRPGRLTVPLAERVMFVLDADQVVVPRDLGG